MHPRAQQSREVGAWEPLGFKSDLLIDMFFFEIVEAIKDSCPIPMSLIKSGGSGVLYGCLISQDKAPFGKQNGPHFVIRESQILPFPTLYFRTTVSSITAHVSYNCVCM